MVLEYIHKQSNRRHCELTPGAAIWWINLSTHHRNISSKSVLPPGESLSVYTPFKSRLCLANYWQTRKNWTIQYDTIRLTIFTCTQKPTSSQLNLPHGTVQKRVMKKLKPKNGDTQKKRSGREIRGVSPEAGRESMVGKICERGRSWGKSERKRELWMVRVVSWKSEMW